MVALLAEEGPRRHGWPARLAVRLATRWSDAEHEVLLADGDLSDAPLHQVVGGSNEEGLADVILYGASWTRVAKEVGDGSYRFVPSGTVVADPESAYRDPRWSAVLSGARGAGSVLMLYLPAESAGAGRLASEADRVIRLTSGPPTEKPEPEVTVIHDLGPSDREGARAKEGESPSSVPAEVPGVAATEAEEGSGGRPGIGEQVSARRFLLPIVLTFVILLVFVALLLALLGYVTIPGISFGAPGIRELPELLAAPTFTVNG